MLKKKKKIKKTKFYYKKSEGFKDSKGDDVMHFVEKIKKKELEKKISQLSG